MQNSVPVAGEEGGEKKMAALQNTTYQSTSQPL